MSTMQDRIFKMAYKAGELSDYLCGIGAYDLQAARIGAVINTSAIMHKIYSYHAANKDDNMPHAFANALLDLANNTSSFSVYVVMDIIKYHIWAEENCATFKIDCTPILDALRSNIKTNADLYSQPTEFRGFVFPNGISSLISDYDEKFRQYGYSILP